MTTKIEAQDITRNMFATNGKIVFKVAKVVPMNLVGVKIVDEAGIRIETTYTHVQIVTSRGNVINARIDDEFALV